MSDLVAEVNKIKGKENSEVAPLPEFTHIPSYYYGVDEMRDPFIAFDGPPPPPPPPCEGDICKHPPPPPGCPHRPDQHRVRVGLELLPLDSLRMIGTLEEENKKGNTLWALVMASDGTVYRIQQGEFVGQNSGKIINIEEHKMELKELLPNKEECWTETVTTLELSS